MGYDAACTLTIDGKSTRGTAWLEHKELIFRGSTRLAIPLANISSATARDGTLHVTFGDRRAAFAVGDAAAKWAKRITSPPSRLDKLGIKAGMTVALIDVADPSLAREIADRGAIVTGGTSRDVKRADVVVYGANARSALARLGALAKLLQPDGAIWTVRPKGRPEITEADTMAAGKSAGLVDVKVVSFSDTHTAEKFVIPVASRPARKAGSGDTRQKPRRR